MRTVYRWIRTLGLCSYRPHFALPLTPKHWSNWPQWSRKRLHWNKEWNTVVVSDESRFCLGMHDDRRRVSSWYGEQRDPQCGKTCPLYCWGSGMATIAYSRRSTLACIRGNMLAQRYIQNMSIVLLGVLVLQLLIMVVGHLWLSLEVTCSLNFTSKTF